MFLLFKEASIELWKKKFDWIASRGGMALLNTHPDYMTFGGKSRGRVEYPVEFYREFLVWVKQKYAGEYWQATPHEVGELVWRARKEGTTKGQKRLEVPISSLFTLSPITSPIDCRQGLSPINIGAVYRRQ